MRILINEKTEILDIEEIEYQKTFNIGDFLFEVLNFDFETHSALTCCNDEMLFETQDKRLQEKWKRENVTEKILDFIEDILSVSEIFLYIFWEHMSCNYEDNNLFEELLFPKNKIDLSEFFWYFNNMKDLETVSDKEFYYFANILGDILYDFKEFKEEILNNIVKFCLDKDFSDYDFSNMTPMQRWNVYAIYSQISSPKELFTQSNEEISEEVLITGKNRTFCSDSIFHREDEESESWSDDFLDLPEILKKHRNDELITRTAYNVEGLYGICFGEFYELLLANTKIQKCKYCGKYFVPYSEKSEYCSRIIKEKGKTCKEYAPQYYYREKGKEDEISEIFTKAFNAHYKRHRRNPDHFKSPQFELWKTNAEEQRERAANGEISVEEFRTIIKPNKINFIKK